MNFAIQDNTQSLVNPISDRKVIRGSHFKVPQRLHFVLFEVAPFLGLIIAIILLPTYPPGGIELSLFVCFWILTQLGFSVGLHRLFSHNAFKTSAMGRAIWAILGCMAAPGPLLLAVAAHRRHHEYADQVEDPHSPNVYGEELWVKIHGFWHAHQGWLATNDEHPNTIYYVPDLLRDKTVTTVSRYYLVWVFLGFLIPTAIAGIAAHSWMGAFLGFLWGGLVRMCFVNSLINGVNSFCHVMGGRAFNTPEYSRNLLWLAIPSLGEGWHNSHHAFPQSAVFGLEWWQFDFGGLVILALQRLNLVWDVNVPSAKMIKGKKALLEQRPHLVN